jgi:hypothetical protein
MTGVRIATVQTYHLTDFAMFVDNANYAVSRRAELTPMQTAGLVTTSIVFLILAGWAGLQLVTILMQQKGSRYVRSCATRQKM